MSIEDNLEEKVPFGNNGAGFSPSYKPPPQFKEISTPPLMPGSLPDSAELWLVRIQDNQLKADEFKGKRVELALSSDDGKMGCFEDSKGSSFEILDLHNAAGVQPFAFLPRGDSYLEVSRVSRQVAIVRSLQPIALSRPLDMDQRLSSEPDGKFNVTSSNKQKQGPYMLHEGASSRGTGVQVKEESHAGVSASLSMGVGGFSTVESLQDDEERISTRKLGKLSKKSKRDKSSVNSEAELSTPGSSQRDSDVPDEQASSKKKSRKHKKMKQEQSG